MPHVILKMIAGRSEEKKHELAAARQDAIASVLRCDDASVSVAIFDIASGDWTSKVFVTDIKANLAQLYKAPGYDPLAQN